MDSSPQILEDWKKLRETIDFVEKLRESILVPQIIEEEPLKMQTCLLLKIQSL